MEETPETWTLLFHVRKPGVKKPEPRVHKFGKGLNDEQSVRSAANRHIASVGADEWEVISATLTSSRGKAIKLR